MTFNTEKLNTLIDIITVVPSCISIYIPTNRTGGVQKDKLHFKNALLEAENKLTDEERFKMNCVDQKEVQHILAPAYNLLKDDDFWLHLSDGLVVFINNDFFEYFVVPVEFKPFVYVGKEFYVRHLFPLVAKESRFFLLALSQNQVRFFEGHEHHITPIIINDLVSENIDELITSEEVSLQSYSGGYGHTNIHGQGAGKDQKNTVLKKHLKQIDDGLMEILHDENAPLIIAAVDYLVPIYREISSYQHIVEFNISGNPENDDPVLLHEKAIAMLSPLFTAEQKSEKSMFEYFLTEDKASFSFLHIVAAAKEGRVDSLFVDKDISVVWGFHKHFTDYSVILDEEQNECNTCLLNYVAVQTWKNGGKVYNVSRDEFPKTVSYTNAIFRYSR